MEYKKIIELDDAETEVVIKYGNVSIEVNLGLGSISIKREDCEKAKFNYGQIAYLEFPSIREMNRLKQLYQDEIVRRK